MEWDFLNRRPVIIAIAGSNGSGKTTFYQSHLANTGFRFLNTDVLNSDIASPYRHVATYRDGSLTSGEDNQ